MSAREFFALGTASQVPTRERNHNGYFLRWDTHGLLFDPGEGTQRQMLFPRIAASDVTRILITHFHGDHCLGLAGLFQRISLDGVPHTVEIVYPAYGRDFVERLRTCSAYHDMARIEYREITSPGVVADDGDLRIEAIRLDHSIESWGYRVVEADGVSFLDDELKARGVRGADVGRLQGEGRVDVDGRVVTLEEVSVPRPGQKMAFIMDTRVCDGAYELAHDVDLCVCESTYLESEVRDADANGHLTARQAAEIAHTSGAKKLVLTHFSQRYPSTDAFLAEAQAVHDDVIVVADGDRVELPRRKRPG